jgi:hypothetical protein
MKDTILTLLTSLGVLAVLGIASYFPYAGLYTFILNMVSHLTPPINLDIFRLLVSMGALGVAALIIFLMILLRKSCVKLELKLFQKVLWLAAIYEGAMTVLMLIGLWLDLQADVPSETFVRVGFFFAKSWIN